MFINFAEYFILKGLLVFLKKLWRFCKEQLDIYNPEGASEYVLGPSSLTKPSAVLRIRPSKPRPRVTAGVAL